MKRMTVIVLAMLLLVCLAVEVFAITKWAAFSVGFGQPRRPFSVSGGYKYSAEMSYIDQGGAANWPGNSMGEPGGGLDE